MPSYKTEQDRFLVMVVAEGVSHDLPSAIEEGKADLRERAGLIRKNSGFPLIRGLSCGVTSVKTQVHHDGDTEQTTATLAAWYHLDFDNERMTPLPFRSVVQVSTSVIQEHDVVFCEGY
jgi:hypothetical protein